MLNSPNHEQRSDSDASIGGMKTQAPKCLGIPMREPTKIQLQAPPAHQWELRLPGLPFEVHVCDSGRWVITSGRDSVAYGNEGERDRAAAKAGDVILGWANGIRSLTESEVVMLGGQVICRTVSTADRSPFEHPMAAKVEEKTVTRETAQSVTNKRK